MVYDGFNLTGKVALVTGSNRGLGFEIAKGLALSGARVFINGRSAEAVQAAVQQIQTAAGTAEPLVFDVADYTQISQALATIKEQYNGLDILVNNVGVRARRPLYEFTLTEIRNLLETNLIAAFELSRQAAVQMRAKGGGRIVNVSSIAGSIAKKDDAIYAIAKGGMDSMTRVLATELGEFNITVNSIAPGFFATETNETMVDDEGVAQWLQMRTALGRWARPEEITGAAVFLCSPAASYVSGHTLVVDGGYLSHF